MTSSAAAAPDAATTLAPKRAIAGWVLFDWAAQPFFTLITTFVYAPYFASAVAANPVEGQALWGFATGAAGLLIALSSPMLGAIADATGPRKPWIALFGSALVIGCSLLWFGRAGDPSTVPIALAAYMIAVVGAEFATVFNNAMMPTLAPADKIGRLSGYGWATGFVGGLLSLVIVLGFLAGSPETGKTLIGATPLFGLDPAAREGDRAAGPLAAIWFILFAIPLFLFTPDRPRKMAVGPAARAGFATLVATLRAAREQKNLFRFLLANMAYQDGLVALFAFGGIYAAGVFGWTTIEIGVFGILLTITGVIGAALGGVLDDRFGSKRVVLGALAILVSSAVGLLLIGPGHVFFLVRTAAPMPGDGLFATAPEMVFLGLGAFMGIAAGPLQSASRALLVHLAPKDRIGQFFGLYALSGKVTSFVGPTAVGLVTMLAGDQRAGVSVLVVLFVLGGVLLAGVRTPRD